MINKVPVVPEFASIADIEKLLLGKTPDFETINYIYIVNNDHILKGVVSVKEIFRSPKTTLVHDLISAQIISVRTHTDQERVALLAITHNLKAIPVVDKDNHFLGVIPSETILHILNNEAVENLLRFGGIIQTSAFDNIFHLSLFKSIKHRLPWLILGLIGGILASGIINHFEILLSKNLILVSFIPLIVYMADAVGTQMEALIIRDLAVNPQLEFLKYFFRQFLVVCLISIITSTLLYLGSILIYSSYQISFVLSIAIFFAIISSLFSGLIIPFVFSRFKMDPANASGPIATIIQDILSIIVYFSIASVLLQ